MAVDAPPLIETEPPPVLALAAHPVRWRLLVALGRSDRTVSELVTSVGEPQNLVSYHLGQLRSAGVVSSRRSSADGRDAYYSLDVAHLGDLLGSTAASVHPALGPIDLQGGAATPSRRRPRVLFVCTGNSGRSPMAEALLRARAEGSVEVASAGSRPKPLHPAAVRVLRDRHGIDIEGRPPVALSSLGRRRFDWVVTLCDRVREACPELPGAPELVHWSIADPSAAAAAAPGDAEAGYAAYERTAVELERRIGPLLALVRRSGRAAAAARSTRDPSMTRR